MLFLSGLIAAAAAGCSADPPRRGSRDAALDATGPFDAHRADASEAGRSCASDVECDDGIGCTLDQCAVGNVCRHRPLDEMCPTGQRCLAGSGCRAGLPTTCRVDEDCQDGVFCNGVEQCVPGAGCFPGEREDCDDGNACTLDRCDAEMDGCRYETAPGCDAGVMPTDAGPPCDPFDPTADYTGTYRIAPMQTSACGRATYSVSDATFSVGGGALRVRAGPFDLVQMPAPTGATFDVTASDGSCGNYRLQGRFDCRQRFEGRWSATFFGECGICGNQDAAVVGLRR
ncbi:MAG: hypothetical protein NZ898_03145 [Myxococcota bacterium]|nr:hypothetical protein [Myxococcota bacterium]MDW8361019.1 hypothetical protein [Myxococcales bacterium]